MPTNLELKAYCPDPGLVRERCAALGATLVTDDVAQKDTYFRAANGRLKLRCTDGERPALVHYVRPGSLEARLSHFMVVPIPAPPEGIERILRDALGVRVVVEKTRTQYRLPSGLVNLDRVQHVGDIVELELAADLATAPALIQEFSEMFRIAIAHRVAMSNAELVPMYLAAAKWRTLLAGAQRSGRLLLVDGPSCSGKSSLVHTLLDREPRFAPIPRYCTRERRPDDTPREYTFVSRDAFDQMTAAGGFLEYRDFEFGMSYGVPWAEALEPVLRGGCAVGVMNWGNIYHVKRIIPEATVVYIEAPLETLANRLRRRGYNEPKQIEERLGNASLAPQYRPYYDHIVSNDDGQFESAARRLMEIAAG